MIDAFGETQQRILGLLMRKKQGCTIDDLIDELEISRTAVTQHLSSLERLNYIERGFPQETGGRPVQIYKLSAKGYDLFPKQYSWFSEIMIEAIKKDKGSEGLKKWMEELAQSIARNLQDKIKGLDFKSKLEAISKIMNDLAYDAKVGDSVEDRISAIEATNCVYHNTAKRFPEVCRFDTALLETLSGAEVIHQKCIVKGDNICRFQISTPKR